MGFPEAVRNITDLGQLREDIAITSNKRLHNRSSIKLISVILSLPSMCKQHTDTRRSVEQRGGRLIGLSRACRLLQNARLE